MDALSVESASDNEDELEKDVKLFFLCCDFEHGDK